MFGSGGLDGSGRMGDSLAAHSSYDVYPESADFEVGARESVFV